MSNQNYISTSDYKSIWQLGFATASNVTEVDQLTAEIKTNIQRISAAILRNELAARGRYFRVLGDDSFLTLLLQFHHFAKLFKCVHRGQIDQKYLSKIHVLRSDFLEWCEKEYVNPPSDWITTNPHSKVSAYDSSEDENEGWYDELTERRKKRVACLELAKRIWEEHPEWSYEQVYNDVTMKRFGNPNVFSFDTFKKWSRPFSPDLAKEGGRPIKNK